MDIRPTQSSTHFSLSLSFGLRLPWFDDLTDRLSRYLLENEKAKKRSKVKETINKSTADGRRALSVQSIKLVTEQ